MSEAALASSTKSGPPQAFRFKPGQSGNPGGRPRKLAELAALSQSCYPEALRRLVELINSRNEDTAKWAITVVLGYVLGKPADSIVMLEGLKARLGENLMTPIQAIAQHSEEVPAPSLAHDEPAVSPLPPSETPPEAPAVTPVGGEPLGLPNAPEGLGFTMTPERAEFLRDIAPDKPLPLSPAVGAEPMAQPAVLHRCVYRTVGGQCESSATEGPYCPEHKAKLFSTLGAK